MDSSEQISEVIEEEGIERGYAGIASFLGWQCIRKGSGALRIVSFFQGSS
jgi:hypothetical protein